MCKFVLVFLMTKHHSRMIFTFSDEAPKETQKEEAPEIQSEIMKEALVCNE